LDWKGIKSSDKTQLLQILKDINLSYKKIWILNYYATAIFLELMARKKSTIVLKGYFNL
jgi:hypothetical protein